MYAFPASPLPGDRHAQDHELREYKIKNIFS